MHVTTNYIGRFAPSPTGPLHFGSLVGALVSYLHARKHRGQWLVRMEDLDPPREMPGAADRILRSLEAHGLHWHGSVLYQSSRLEAYSEQLEQLLKRGLAYRCNCNRQRIRTLGGRYDNRCRNLNVSAEQPHAIRLRVDADSGVACEIEFDDLFLGPQQQDVAAEVGDVILKRKDGLFAYQLAVVVDDIYQKISHVIRGSDLLDSSARQIYLTRQLKAPELQYGHFPVVIGDNGQKLSKQNLAPALDDRKACDNLWLALLFLRQTPPDELRGAKPQALLEWAVEHANLAQIPSGLGAPLPAARA